MQPIFHGHDTVLEFSDSAHVQIFIKFCTQLLLGSARSVSTAVFDYCYRLSNVTKIPIDTIIF